MIASSVFSMGRPRPNNYSDNVLQSKACCWMNSLLAAPSTQFLAPVRTFYIAYPRPTVSVPRLNLP